MDDSADEQAVDEGVIRCICEITDDDGYTICCEKCLVWQHAVCVGITPDNEPDKYYCEECNPRELDAQVTHFIQSKRLKDERKKKEEEKRLKRLEKQSPRKRNQSQEFDGRRKRKESGGQLSPRKRLKDSDPITKAKIERSFTETGIRDPIIRKKNPEVIADFTTAYEAEYTMNSIIFAKLRRMSYTESTYQLLEKIFEESKTWPLVPVYDPYAESKNDEVHMAVDFKNSEKLSVLYNSIPSWLMNASNYQKEPFVSGAKKFGLFSNHDLKPNCFISEICGRMSTIEDLYLKHDFLIPMPVDKELGENSDILPPFVFPLPKFVLGEMSENISVTQLFLDARDSANFDGRFVQSSCDPTKVNAEFKFVVVIDEFEIGDRLRYDTLPQAPEDAVSNISLSSRFKLCLFTTKQINRSEEIIVANPIGNTYLFSCTCTKSCKVTESVKKIEEYRNRDYGDEIMQTPYFDDLQARQDERQAAIDKDVEQLQQVPNNWVYHSPAELEKLCKDYIANLIEKGEMEEEVVVEHVPHIEVKEEEEGQVEEVPDTIDAEVETGQISESEPEKEEPRRVSFQDFMRQLSSTSAAPPAIPSPVVEESSVQEVGESSSIISTSAIEDLAMKVEQSPEDTEVIPTLKKPLPARISLDSDAIRALASSLPQIPVPSVSKKEISSPLDPRLVVEQSQISESASISQQTVEPPASAPVFDRSPADIVPPRSAPPLDIPQIPEAPRPLSRMSDDFRGSNDYARAPSYDRVWKEERSTRERRESDPSYPLYNRELDFDSPPDRSYNTRDSFPPPGNRGPRDYRSQTWSDPRANDDISDEPLSGPPRGRAREPPLGREMPRDRDLPPRDGPQGYPRREYYPSAMRGRGRGAYEGRGGFYRGGPDSHGPPPFDRYPPREGPPYPRREYYPQYPMRGRGRRGR